jgi:tetratricopeptide (TPR) repeat protein
LQFIIPPSGSEKHYKKALELKPDNAEINSNYAQFLFIKGEESQAQVYLDKAFNFADNQDLLVELWFYRLEDPETLKNLIDPIHLYSRRWVLL